jgi:hypothetical protein
MALITDDEWLRRKNARDQNKHLKSMLLQVEAGLGDFGLFSRVINHSAALHPQKMLAISAAQRHGWISWDEVTASQVEPHFSDFGLESESYEYPFVLGYGQLEKHMEVHPKLSGLASLIAIAGCWAVGFGYFRHWKNEEIFPSLVLGGLSVVGVFIFGLFASVFFYMIWGALHPTAQLDKRYKAAKTRFALIQQVRDIISKANTAASFYNATGREFEMLVATVFRKWGYEAREVGGANDGGVDLVVARGSERGVVQCKAHAKPVGPAVVRELFGALQHSNANHAYLATLYGVTASASDWIIGKPITVLTTEDLLRPEFTSNHR